jgi:3-methyladenine DNA glycosylase Tag
MSVKKPVNFPASPRGGHPCKTGVRPGSDNGYFEMMSRCIFRTGLNWAVIDKKWPGFQIAFAGFDVKKISQFDQRHVDELMNDTGIIRNLKKIQATIDNSREFISIQIDHGSFEDYLDGIRRGGDDEMVKQLSKRFRHMGPTTSVMFLKSIGEELPEITARWMEGS